MSLIKGIAGASVALLMMAGAAVASPTFSSGSLSFAGGTTTTTNVLTTTQFQLKSTSESVFSTTGDFGSVTLNTLTSLAASGLLDVNNASSFSYDAGTVGSFAASSITALSPSSGPGSATANYSVTGWFTLGSDWSNAGQVVFGRETVGFTQTGGTGTAISLSGTYASTVPEPATLTLLGAGLIGVGAFGRRRKKKAA